MRRGDWVEKNSSHDSEVPYLVKESLKDGEEVTVFAEPQHHARKTLCCGAGGGRMWMEEEPNQRPGNRRAQELIETGAKAGGGFLSVLPDHVGCEFEAGFGR